MRPTRSRSFLAIGTPTAAPSWRSARPQRAAKAVAASREGDNSPSGPWQRAAHHQWPVPSKAKGGDQWLERIVREHAARLAAAPVRFGGDFAAAEDAELVALRRWPLQGVPERPDSRLVILARNRGLHSSAREAN